MVTGTLASVADTAPPCAITLVGTNKQACVLAKTRWLSQYLHTSANAVIAYSRWSRVYMKDYRYSANAA